MSNERSDTRNLISGYPTGVSCRYVAETFGDKLREQKLREKQMFSSLLDAEFFKIKRKHREVDVDVKTSFFHGICEFCNPNARAKIDNYFVNVLETQQLSLLRWAKNQFFVYPRFIFTRNERCVDCSVLIFKSEEFREYLDQFLLDCDTSGLKYKRQTVTHEMLRSWTKKTAVNLSYSFSSLIFKTIAIGLYLVSTKFMNKLIVSPVEMKCLKEMKRDYLPVVYVVQSQTKFDWLKILCLLVFRQMKPPVIFLPGEEHPWLRWVYRKCGVTFFISSTGEKTLKSEVRDEIFITYVDENLKKGNHLMFYFNSSVEEDDRYLLDLIVDGIRRTSVEDATIVPVSVCHEKVKQIGDSESFKFSIADLISTRDRNNGFVKITFSQPYSLLEMIRSVGTREESQTYDPAITKYDEHGNSIVTKIYRHIAYDFCKIRALTSTNIVSYLLLKKFRNGVRRGDLVHEVDEFRLLLKSHEKPVAFTGSSGSVVDHALSLLNPGTVSVDKKSDSWIKPVMKLPYVSEISYYANFTLQYFMLDAIIMRSLYILRKEQLEEAFKSPDKDISFFYEEFMQTAQELCDILQFESPFFKPCRPVDSQIDDGLFKFICYNYITKVEKLMTAEEEWSRRVARNLEGFESDDGGDDDYDDDFENDDYSYTEPAPTYKSRGAEYQINHRDDPSVIGNIFFYKNSINAIIEAYVVNAENLKELVGKQVTDSAYFRKLKSKMTMMLAAKELEYPECVSVDTLKNSMKLFIAWDVVQSHLIDGIEVFYLSKDFDGEDKLLPIVEKIKKYR